MSATKTSKAFPKKSSARAKAAKANPAPEGSHTPSEPSVTNAGPTTVPIAEMAEPKTPSRKTTSPDIPKKLSALDAAAKVLAESNEPMNTKAMIDAMSSGGYWTSPGGKTPAATLYSALLREIETRKDQSRFRKASKGHFEATGK